MFELKEYTRVKFVYPRYPDGQREVLAVFPDDKERDGSLTCYAHIGQHSTAHPSFLKRKAATPTQYAALEKELRGRGYNLIVLNRPNTSKQLFKDIAQDYSPKNDPWGYAMGAAFDIAAACYLRGLPNVLDYSPGMGGADIEDPWNRKVLMRMNPQRLERLARYTNRVLAMLKRAGRDY